MKLGCSTILYGGQDLSLALDHIAKAGYGAVELCAIPGMAPHLKLGETPAYYGDVKKAVSDRGLSIESVGASGNIGDPTRFLQVLDAAAAVGAPCITSGPGGKSDDEASYREVVQKFRVLAGEARARGVRISVKPHVTNAVYDTKTALRFMGDVDRDWIGINYDPTHIWRTPHKEVPEQTLDPLLPHMMSIRIRDVKGRQLKICPVAQQVAGEGDLNLRALAAKLRTAPRVTFAVLEIVGTKEMPVAEIDSVIRRSFEGFQPLFA
jgi:sugar phosphate isomerase/epimerase